MNSMNKNRTKHHSAPDTACSACGAVSHGRQYVRIRGRHLCGPRYLRRDDLRPPLPKGHALRCRESGNPSPVWQPVRSLGRRDLPAGRGDAAGNDRAGISKEIGRSSSRKKTWVFGGRFQFICGKAKMAVRGRKDTALAKLFLQGYRCSDGAKAASSRCRSAIKLAQFAV